MEATIGRAKLINALTNDAGPDLISRVVNDNIKDFEHTAQTRKLERILTCSNQELILEALVVLINRTEIFADGDKE